MKKSNGFFSVVVVNNGMVFCVHEENHNRKIIWGMS